MSTTTKPHSVCSQLAALLDAGLSPTEALSTLNNQAALLAIRQGKTFSVAMERMGCFSARDLSAITMSEQAGVLPQSLRLLAEHHERIDRARKKLRTAAIYPLILLLIASVLANIPALLNDECSLGSFLLQSSLLPALLLGGGVLARTMLRHPDHGRSIHSMLHHAPIVGSMLQQHSRWKFLSLARILVGAGVGIQAAFRELAASSADPRLAGAIQTWEDRLAQGISLADALYTIEIFDPEVRQLLGNAAQSGRMEEALQTLAALQASTAAHRAQLVYTLLPTLSIFGVLLLLLLGFAL